MGERSECKVDRTIDRYELCPPGDEFDSIDELLVARWTGEADGDSVGYKQLTEWFNKRLLKDVYEREGRETLGARLDSEYEALTGDDELLRAEVEDDLQTDGIDADGLQQAMVSWSTMRRHIKECLGAEKQRQEASSDWEVNSVEIARQQFEGKAGDALRSLESKGRLPEATKADIDVQLKLSCPECPTRVPLEDALSRGYVCESHFDEEDTSERVRLSETSSALLPAGAISSFVSDSSAVLFEILELSGGDLSALVLDVGSALAI